MRVLQEIEPFSDVIELCMGQLMVARSFKDPQNQAKEISGNQVFASIITVLYEYVFRYDFTSGYA